MTTIAVDLHSNIIYVAGYVNDISTVFTQDDIDKKWRASVVAVADSLYHINLELHDEAGNISHFEKTLEYILPWFVYDRTQEDVDRVYEFIGIGWRNLSETQKQEWLSGMKGCLNTVDLKRIENDIYVIAQLLNVEIQTNKDNLPDIPNSLYFKKLADNVAEIRNSGYLLADTPMVPTQPFNTYEKINAIERILHDVYYVYKGNTGNFYYCGTETYAGDDTALLI